MAVAALDRFVLDHLSAVRTLLHGRSPRGRDDVIKATGKPRSGAGGGPTSGAFGSMPRRWGSGSRCWCRATARTCRRCSTTPSADRASAFVLADRPGIRALERAAAHGVETARDRAGVVPGSGRVRRGGGASPAAAMAPTSSSPRATCGCSDAPVLDVFGGRWLNTHPALLPSFPGMHGVRDALAYGVKVTGVTVFLVDEGIDTGPIVLQEAIEVRDDDDWDSLEPRILDVEHRLLPRRRPGAGRGSARRRGSARDDHGGATMSDVTARAAGDPGALRQVRVGGVRGGAGRAGRGAGRLGWHRARADRGGPRRDAGRAGHRLARDARRAGEDAAPRDPRRVARRSPQPRRTCASSRSSASSRSTCWSPGSTRSARPSRAAPSPTP